MNEMNNSKIGLSKKSIKLGFSLCVLCEALCDPLCLNDLKLNTKDTKVSTKAHKGLFQQPPERTTQIIYTVSAIRPGKLSLNDNQRL